MYFFYNVGVKTIGFKYTDFEKSFEYLMECIYLLVVCSSFRFVWHLSAQVGVVVA